MQLFEETALDGGFDLYFALRVDIGQQHRMLVGHIARLAVLLAVVVVLHGGVFQEHLGDVLVVLQVVVVFQVTFQVFVIDFPAFGRSEVILVLLVQLVPDYTVFALGSLHIIRCNHTV